MTTLLAPTAYDVLCARHAAAAMRLIDAVLPVEREAGRDLSGLLERAEVDLRPAYDAGQVTAASFRPRLLDSVRRQVEPVRTQPPAAVTRAFWALSPAAQGRLWLGEVERWSDPGVQGELDVDDLASAAAARDELVEAIVVAHEDDVQRPVCRQVRVELVAHLRAALAHSEMIRVSAHLECCRRCTAVYLELSEAQTDPAGLVARAVLGAAAPAYLATLPERHAAGARERLAGFVGTSAGRGLVAVAAAAVVVAGLALTAGSGVLGGNGGDTGGATTALAPPVTAPDSPRAARAGRAVAVVQNVSARGSADNGPAASARPSAPPTSQPTSRPTSQPTSRPTSVPTSLPTAIPTTVDVPRVATPVDEAAPAQQDVTLAVPPLAAVTLGPDGLSLTSDLLATSVRVRPGCPLVVTAASTC